MKKYLKDWNYTIKMSVAKTRKPRAVKEAASAEVVPTTEQIDVIVSDIVSNAQSESDTAFSELVARLDEELKATQQDKARNVPTKTWKELIKLVNRAQKLAKKATRRRRNANAGKSNENSGFNKPVAVSESMAKFLKSSPSELHSRSEVTKAVCAYIREHALQDPERRKIIVPDKRLTKLLNYNAAEEPELTYPYLQVKLKDHFPKSQ